MKYFITFLLLSNALLVFGQKNKKEEKDAFAVVEQLFKAMKASDSTMLRAAFHKKAALFTSLVNKEGKPMVVSESVDGFVRAVGTPHPEVYDERIGKPIIQIDDNLATIWTEYEFFIGTKFSHCGVNSFQLVKTEEGWKILNVTDTRRKAPCKSK